MKDCCPPRWNWIGSLLTDLMVDLFRMNPRLHHYAAPDQTWEALTLYCFAEELRLRQRVDGIACRASKHDLAPGSLSSEERHYLALRIQCAMDFLGMAFPPQATCSPFGEPPEDWTDAQVLEWLLVDLWFRRHDHWLKLEAMAVAGPFALYGIGPADPGATE